MKKFLLILLGLITVMLSACGNGTTSDKENGKTGSAKKAAISFKDDILKVENATIKLIGTEIIPADAENGQIYDVFVITYDYTNEKDIQSIPAITFSSSFSASQNDSLLAPGVVVDSRYAELTKASMTNVEKGKTIQCHALYQLNDLTTPVILTGKDMKSDTDLGKKTYSLQ